MLTRVILISVMMLSVTNQTASAGNPIEFTSAGEYSAMVGIFSIDRETAQSLLDPALELVPQPLAPAGKHPVVLMFGYQKDVRPIKSGATLPKLSPYEEFIISIPYTRIKLPPEALQGKKNGPYSYMVQLYLNNMPAVVAGWHYGYNKSMSTISSDAAFYAVTTESGNELLISGEFQVPTGKKVKRLIRTYKNLMAIAPIMKQPIIGNLNGKLSHSEDKYRCSKFSWNFLSMRASPVKMKLELGSSFLGGVLGLEKLMIPSMDQSPLGAYKFTSKWKLSEPLDCAVFSE